MYKLVLTKKFENQFKKLDRHVQKIIAEWMKRNLQDGEEPRTTGEALTGNLKGYWRYRVADY